MIIIVARGELISILLNKLIPSTRAWHIQMKKTNSRENSSWWISPASEQFTHFCECSNQSGTRLLRTDIVALKLLHEYEHRWQCLNFRWSQQMTYKTYSRSDTLCWSIQGLSCFEKWDRIGFCGVFWHTPHQVISIVVLIIIYLFFCG